MAPRRRGAAAPTLLLALLLSGAVAARTPLPPHGDRSVQDGAGVISAADAAAMETLHAQLFAATGVAIVVLTVPRLVDETIEELAVRAGHDWGAGRAGEDRGIVIALAVEDRRIFVATGYGVEGYLPDGRVGALLDRHALPHLRDRAFSTGLRELSAVLAAASAEEYGVTLDGLPAAGSRRRGAPPLLALLLLLLVFYLIVRHPRLLLLWWLAGGRGRGGLHGGGFGRGGFGGGGGFGGFRGGGFGGGGAGRSF